MLVSGQSANVQQSHRISGARACTHRTLETRRPGVLSTVRACCNLTAKDEVCSHWIGQGRYPSSAHVTEITRDFSGAGAGGAGGAGLAVEIPRHRPPFVEQSKPVDASY
jgi:hypothetical protein